VKWLDCESEYRKVVKAIAKADRSGGVTRSDALALVQVRARADKLRDRYLKQVLPAKARR
jgi:hypothetical protein